MKSLFLKCLFGCVLIAGLAGCVGIEPPLAAITNIKYPHQQAVTDGVLGSKTGESGITTIFIFGSFGDASVVAAAKKGGISKIKTIDHRYFTVLGIIQKYSTIVTGE